MRRGAEQWFRALETDAKRWKFCLGKMVGKVLACILDPGSPFHPWGGCEKSLRKVPLEIRVPKGYRIFWDLSPLGKCQKWVSYSRDPTVCLL